MPLPPIRPAQLEWRDNTPCARDFGDFYFSSDDGLAESRYVFIDGNQLGERWPQCEHFTLGETGFGSGLNFLLCAEQWLTQSTPQQRLHYISVEKHPLTKTDLTRVLQHWPQLHTIGAALLAHYPPLVAGQHRLSLFDGRIQLDLLWGEASEMLRELQCPQGIDAWLLDGFAPSKNPAMWRDALYQEITRLSHHNSTLATFTAAGDVRRGLAALGWQIKKRPGFGKKREMLVGQLNTQTADAAIKPANHAAPWFAAPTPIAANREKHAIVIGAGLAGCASAHALANSGWQITLLEQEARIAAAASGNLAGVVMPRLSADMGNDGHFYLSAFLHSVRCLQQLQAQHPELNWQASGVRQRSHAAYQDKLRALAVPREILDFDGDDLLFPQAGWLSPPELCQTLLDSSANITLRTHQQACNIKHSDTQWQVWDDDRLLAQAPVLILANGYDAARLFPGHALQLQKVRGQLAYLRSTAASEGLQQPLCFDGYVLPALDGVHVTGATYRHGSDDTQIDTNEAMQLKAQLSAQLPEFASNEICGGRVAFRTSSPDRLPLVGAMPDLDFFCRHYGDLHHGKPATRYPQAQHLPGLYLNTGHGSRGLSSCLLAAELIAAQINGSPTPLPASLINALNPARFLIRNLKRGQAL